MKKGKFKILKTSSLLFVFCFCFYSFNSVFAGNLMLNMTPGNVGIGVAVPVYKLDVSGDINSSGSYKIDGVDVIDLNKNWTGNTVSSAKGGTGLTSCLNGQILKWNGSSWTCGNDAWTPSGSNLYYNVGYVGIGTTTPTQLLTVGNAKSAGNSFYNIGADTIGANTSIYSYGKICAGNNSGSCEGSGGVVLSSDGSINSSVIYTSTINANVINATGSFSAPTFIGDLNGNAKTSTNAVNAGNSDTVDGLHIHLGRNNEVNKVVRTDGSGYLQVGYINSSNGDEGNNLNPAKVWGTNGTDSYLRTYNTSALSVNYAATAGTANSVAWANVSGRPSVTNNQEGYRYSTDYNSILSTGFFNGEASPVNAPNPYGQLIVARGIDTGLQIAGGYNSDNLYFRGWWNSGAGFSPWRTIINSGNIGSQSVNYATSAGTATSATIASTAVNATSASIAGYANIAGTANSVTWDSVTGKPNMSANNFQWTWAWGPVGNPTYLWGSNDGSNMNLYNPANFSVNHAATAGTADYSRYVYNNGAYSGSGWAEPSDLGVRYANSANTATNAGYASTAGYTSVAARAYSADNGVPSGAIMAFRLSSCPYWLELCRYSLWLCIS